MPAGSSPEQEQEQEIYEVRRKIYPRAVHGWFAGWRIFFVILTQAVFYGLPWLHWNGRQAVLFDLAARKFHIFGLVFWPQDFIYLTALLVIAALSLFLFTAIAGRLWCGYACPQTVYTDIFLRIERWIEGDRVARIRLDAAPLSLRKIAIKAAKHAAWLALALWTGYTFVGYFTPIQDLGFRALAWRLDPWETFWVLFYALATYGNAGWMREQVCKYMCPYARFQSVMFDHDTLTITYDGARGEPRGPRSKKVDRRAAGIGDCVDCQICVQVCPVGIDIRQGLQYECIGCAACVDGCDQVMDKMGYPQGLIRYTTENALALGYDAHEIRRRVRRPRTLIYAGVLIAVTGATIGSIALRNPLKVDVIRDRAALAREAAPGIIENVYRVQVMNTDETPRRYTIRAEGLPGLKVAGVEQPIALGAAEGRPIALRLQAPVAPGAEGRSDEGRGRADELTPGAHKIELVVQAVDDEGVVRHEKSSFIVPR
ncbi:MAG TPA: cytochrome c oxidase accessory protein CcoG [Casimicrobiaceae bacterium]|nr:cytochrome c oxidase accessory protein CcoG [Casimicrobiaceae bacterium]